jgi:carboxypeptidase C (cathepsin A)
VRGAGHMVPTDKPEPALRIIKELLGIQSIWN